MYACMYAYIGMDICMPVHVYMYTAGIMSRHYVSLTLFCCLLAVCYDSCLVRFICFISFIFPS